MNFSAGSRQSATAAVTITFAALLLLLAALMPGTSSARPDSKAVISPIAFDIINRPTPVEAADGRMHLAYEIQAVNQSTLTVTVNRIQARAQKSTIGKSLAGEDLINRTRLNDGTTGSATLGAGESAMLFLDVSYSKKRRNPKTIAHAITTSWPDPVTIGETVKQTFVGVGTKVSRRKAIEVAAPLRGNNWVAASSCCTLNPHRGATLAIDGTIRVPERYAIDFIRMNPEDRLFDGLIGDLGSYAYFGTRIHSATAGKVVRVQDGLPEQVPGALPVGATIQNAAGNHVVVRIGKGRYALYAHMKTGSTRVNVGDKVKPGKVLGLLGNSGNASAPHLHFHVMDSASPLKSNALPFTFKAFEGQGFVTDLDALVAGGDPLIQPNRLAGRHRGQLTLDNQVVSFGGSGR